VNATQLIARLRARLDDNRSLKYTDLDLLLSADDALKYLTRKMSQTAKDWHNFSLGLKRADARTLFQGTYEWTLPTWVKRVSRVYSRNMTATTETTFSPYRWTGGENAQLGEELGKSDSGRRSSWTWEGTNTLRLWNSPEAIDLSLEVVKTPAPLFKVRVVDAFPDASAFYFPSTAAVGAGNGIVLGELNTEEGVYINANVMVSATLGATDTNFGQVRRVVYSNANTIAATRKAPCYVDANFLSALVPGDTVESVLPIPDDFSNLLVALCLRELAVTKGNLDLQKSLAPVIASELGDFLESAGLPKDSAGPYFKTSRVTRSGQYDQDRLNTPRFQWW